MLVLSENLLIHGHENHILLSSAAGPSKLFAALIL